jgi:hypothetical protein
VTMMKALGSSAVVCAFLTFPGPCEAAGAQQRIALTDEQLDKICAGASAAAIHASADGTGSATGTSAHTVVTVTSIAETGAQVSLVAFGQVNASAASNSGPMATASSSLSLLVINP